MRVAIVGAGAIGCAIAGKLARRGCQVTILERGTAGSEASAAAAGILGPGCENQQPGPLGQLCRFSMALWPDFAAALQQRTEIDIGYAACGAVEVAGDAAAADRLQAKAAAFQRAGLDGGRWVDANELRARLPALSDRMFGGLLHDGDGQVEPPLLSRALAIDAQKCGATLIGGRHVRHVAVRAGQVVGVQTDGGLVGADAVVVAAGAWSGELLGGLPLRTGVRPLAGQLLEVDAGLPPMRPVVAWQGGYVVPRRDGRVVIGATSEDVGFLKRQTAGAALQLLLAATGAVPELAGAQLLRHWSGLRPCPADGLPLLGPHPGLAGLHLATGHHRNGILLAPVTAELVAQGVLNAEFSLSIAAFSAA